MRRTGTRSGTRTRIRRSSRRRWPSAFAEGRRVLREDGVGSVVFAHKTTEGWEALLSGMIRGGWTITGSWPIATEMGSRLRARESAALATSVHLICRPRPDDAGVGDWADVLRELPPRVGDWMERLQGEGVRGADLVFACIGPALEIFSRYEKVETADGREVALAEYLAKVWEVVGRSALAQVLGTAEATARNGAAGAVEEDARLTALFLWTLQSTNGESADGASDKGEDEDLPDEDEDEADSPRGKAKGFTLVFDVVRRFAQPLGIELPRWEGRVIETKKGVVRLLPIAERAKQLFGEDGAQAVAARLEQSAAVGTNSLQGMLFPEMEANPKARGRGARSRGGRMGADVSDESLAAARDACRVAGRGAGRGHDPRPRSRGHAATGRRPHQRAPRAAPGRAGARPRLPAPRERLLGALPEGERREAIDRRDAPGGAKMNTMDPMIRSLVLKRFRSVPTARIEFDNPTIFVGRNGSGKSNLVNAFSFLAETVASPLQAVFDRDGGIAAVRNRSSGRSYPPHLGMRVDFGRLNGEACHGFYAFEVKALKNYGFSVVREQCSVGEGPKRAWFDRHESAFRTNVGGLKPAIDRAALGLPVIGGEEKFSPVLRALAGMRVYSIEPGKLRDMQEPDSGVSLKWDGANVTSVLKEIERQSRRDFERISEILAHDRPEHHARSGAEARQEPGASVHAGMG